MKRQGELYISMNLVYLRNTFQGKKDEEVTGKMI